MNALDSATSAETRQAKPDDTDSHGAHWILWPGIALVALGVFTYRKTNVMWASGCESKAGRLAQIASAAFAQECRSTGFAYAMALLIAAAGVAACIYALAKS